MAAPAETDLAPAPEGWRRWFASGHGRWLAILLTLAFAAAMLVPDPGAPLLRQTRLLTFDLYQSMRVRERISGPAMIVEIDDDSLKRVGQWPWPRTTTAALIDRIAQAEPAAIGLDVVFSEPDRTSPEQIARSTKPREGAAPERLPKTLSNDAVFADAIARSDVVLGIAGVEEASSGGDAAAAPPPPAPAPGSGAAASIHRYTKMFRSLPAFESVAKGHGMINSEPERGIVRRVPIIAYIADQLYLTLSLESLRIALGSPPFETAERGGLTFVKVGDYFLPVEPDGRAWVHFSKSDPARFMSAADVLEGKHKAENLKGRIVLVGVTAHAFSDLHTTPLGEQIPGIEIHAQLVENIFDGALLTRPVWARYIETVLFLIGATVLVMFVGRVRPRWSFVILLGCSFATIALGASAFAGLRMLFDPTTPVIGMTAVYGLMLSATLVGLDLERRTLSARLASEREAAARVTGELEAAKRIQIGMLPTRESVLQYERRVELFAHMSAAREVGGDLYDFFPLPGDRFVVFVGDVSGKGLPAAMFMAVSKALAKSAAMRSVGAGPAEIMSVLNSEISRENPEQNFVTMAALVIDLKTGQLDYCNAGHEPPILSRRSGEILVLDEGGGPPVCVMEGFEYEQASIRLEPRDVLVLASDGLTEAMNAKGELYGRQRLQTLLDSPVRRNVDPTVLGNEILTAIRRFESGSEPADDQTLLLVSWRGAL